MDNSSTPHTAHRNSAVVGISDFAGSVWSFSADSPSIGPETPERRSAGQWGVPPELQQIRSAPTVSECL